MINPTGSFNVFTDFLGSGEAGQLYRFDNPWALIAMDFKLMPCFFV
jgi:hypothetical protein